jgi:hypothetical protein
LAIEVTIPETAFFEANPNALRISLMFRQKQKSLYFLNISRIVNKFRLFEACTGGLIPRRAFWPAPPLSLLLSLWVSGL